MVHNTENTWQLQDEAYDAKEQHRIATRHNENQPICSAAQVNYREHKYAAVVLDLNNEDGGGGREYNTITGKEK